MPNLTDYLFWRGDLLLDERPLDDADALCLAALSYLDLSEALPTPQAILPLGEACAPLLGVAQDELESRVHSLADIDRRFISALSSSARFGSSVVRAYTQVGGTPDEGLTAQGGSSAAREGAPGVRGDEPGAQFAALTVDLGARLTAVAFRGTDLSLVGWRENFMLGFRVTPAQELAAEYLLRELRSARDRGRRVVACGHSKGGNLAEYACLRAPEDLQALVDRCWSFDGPGTDPEVVPGSAAGRLRGRLSRVRPAYSVVGELFDRPDEPRAYVESDARGIAQHDLMSWQTAPEGLVRAEGLDRDAETLDRAIADWMGSVGMEERQTLTDELFDALAAGGARTLDEVGATARSVQRVAAAALTSSVSTKQVVARLLAALFGANVDAARSRAAEALGDAWRSVASLAPGGWPELGRRDEGDAAPA